MQIIWVGVTALLVPTLINNSSHEIIMDMIFHHISFKDIEESQKLLLDYLNVKSFRGCNWPFYWRVNGS